MKKGRNLLILVIVLALLGGAYAFISTRPKNSTDTSAQKIKLSVLDSAKMTKMSLGSKDGTLEFIKNGDIWQYKNDTSMKLNQENLNNMAKSFANVYADKVVDQNPSNLEEYGLKDEAATAYASFSDGSEVSLNIGSQTPGGDAYYMMIKGDPKLYTISSADGDNYKYTLTDLRDNTLSTLGADNINYLRITSGDKTVELKKLPANPANPEASGVDSWIMSKPYKLEYTAPDSLIQGILEGVSGLAVTKFVESNPSDYSKYGLDKPVREIFAQGEDQTLDVFIGKDADSGSVYFKTGSSKEVYTLDKGKLDIFNAKAFDLIYKYAYMSNLDDVDQVIIENSGKKDVLSIERTSKPAANSGEQPQTESTFKLNGSTVDETKFRDFYQKLIGLTVDVENDKTVAQNPDVKMTFILNKGSVKQDIVAYCPYNTDFYAVFRNGVSDFLISKSQVQNVLNGLQNLK